MSQDQSSSDWHEVLLALSGRIPDDAVARARAATTNDERLFRVTAGVAEVGSSITADELQALVQVVEPGGADTIARILDAHGDLSLPAFRFSPLDPTDGPPPISAAAPVSLDLSGDDPAGWADAAAVAAVGAATADPGVLGLWAAWREPFEVGSNGEGVRVFLVEVGEPAEPAEATVRFQDAVAAADESGSRIEVFSVGARLTGYQRSVLGAGALLWTAKPESVPEVVPVFDGVDPETGPRFDTGHVSLAADERAVVAGYLYGAEAVMYTTATMVDVVDPERGEVVPLSFRTDGEYVWPEAVAYYVDQHGLAPYGPLLDAIRSADYQPRRPDSVARFRAEHALFATE